MHKKINIKETSFPDIAPVKSSLATVMLTTLKV